MQITRASLEAAIIPATGGSVFYQLPGSGTDSWASLVNATVTRVSGELNMASTSAVYPTYLEVSMARTLTGLTVGGWYRFEAAVRRASGNTWAPIQVKVTGITGALLETTISDTTGTTVACVFQATSTSHQLVVRKIQRWPGGDTGGIRVIPAVYAVSPVALAVKTADISLDDTRTPYARAELVVARPSVTVDPRDSPRLFITDSLEFVEPVASPQARTFDLLVHEASPDWANDTLTIVAHSDEAAAIDAGYMPPPGWTNTYDSEYEEVADSLRDVLNLALPRNGGTLEASPSDDADLTVTWELTNLITNPSCETDATGWGASTGTSAVARSNTVGGKYGSWALRGTSDSASSSMAWNGSTGNGVPVTGGTLQHYQFRVWIRSQVARTASVSIQWRDSAGAVISTDVGASITTATGSFTEMYHEAVAPTGAAYARPIVTTVGNSVGQFHYIDAAIFSEIDSSYPSTIPDPPYFDGSFAADTYYTYAWTGTAHASTSTRTPIVARDPYLLRQYVGELDWDFWDGPIRASGLRLFCNEAREWRLVDPTSYTPAGTITLGGATNTTSVRESLSLESTRGDGSPVWFNGVVLRYKWTDPDTQFQHLIVDQAGSRQKVWTVDIEGRFPGAGAAAARLAQAQARGRLREIEALTDLTATPGQALETTVGGISLEGVIQSVTWFYSAVDDEHNVMTITARDLVEA